MEIHNTQSPLNVRHDGGKNVHLLEITLLIGALGRAVKGLLIPSYNQHLPRLKCSAFVNLAET